MKIRSKMRNLLLLLPFFIMSCSSDNVSDPAENGNGGGNNPPNETTQAEVKYAVSASTDIISTVQYRLPTGVFADVDDAQEDWSETLPIPLPFNAAMFVQLSNTTDVPQTYSMMIYIDGTLAAHKEGTLAASSSKNDDLSLSVQ